MSRPETLGGLALTDGAAVAVTTQRPQLVLLAVTGERGLTRDKLVAHFWLESPAENPRHAWEQWVLVTSDITPFEQACQLRNSAAPGSRTQGSGAIRPLCWCTIRSFCLFTTCPLQASGISQTRRAHRNLPLVRAA